MRGKAACTILAEKRWEVSEGMTAKTGSQETKISGWSCSSTAEGQTQRMKAYKYRRRDDGNILGTVGNARSNASPCHKWRDWWAAWPHGVTRSSTARRSIVDSGRKWWQMQAWGGRNTCKGGRPFTRAAASPLMRIIHNCATGRIRSRGLTRDFAVVAWRTGWSLHERNPLDLSDTSVWWSVWKVIGQTACLSYSAATDQLDVFSKGDRLKLKARKGRCWTLKQKHTFMCLPRKPLKCWFLHSNNSSSSQQLHLVSASSLCSYAK